MRRFLVVLAIPILAGSSLLGCGSGASPTPPATSTPSPSPVASPAASASGAAGPGDLPAVAPVTADRADDGEFQLSLAVDKGTYAPDELIGASAQLTYVGARATVTAFGSGSGLVIMDLQQLDGPLDPGGGATSDCRPYDLARGATVDIPYQKSGGWDTSDPNAGWYAAFFNDRDLRLPVGIWRLTARLEAATGGTCGDPWHRLETSVTFVVRG